MLSEEPQIHPSKVDRPPALPIDMDDKELCELFASCMPRLARTARHIMRNSADSEDVLQDGLLSAFQKLGQFQGRSKFSTWLHTIVTNSARMHARGKAGRVFCSMEEKLSEEGKVAPGRTFRDSSPDPEALCGQEERARILRRTLRNLPSMYQQVIELCDIREFSRKDAAATLGLSISALKTSLHRARRFAARKIRECYFTNSGARPDPPRSRTTRSRSMLRSRRTRLPQRQSDFAYGLSAHGSIARKNAHVTGVCYGHKKNTPYSHFCLSPGSVPSGVLAGNFAGATCKSEATALSAQS